MKRNVLTLILILTSVVLNAAQNSTTASVVQGTVLRLGTNEPLSEAQISLEGAVSAGSDAIASA
jgi:hypothetical protein